MSEHLHHPLNSCRELNFLRSKKMLCPVCLPVLLLLLSVYTVVATATARSSMSVLAWARHGVAAKDWATVSGHDVSVAPDHLAGWSVEYEQRTSGLPLQMGSLEDTGELAMAFPLPRGIDHVDLIVDSTDSGTTGVGVGVCARRVLPCTPKHCVTTPCCPTRPRFLPTDAWNSCIMNAACVSAMGGDAAVWEGRHIPSVWLQVHFDTTLSSRYAFAASGDVTRWWFLHRCS